MPPRQQLPHWQAWLAARLTNSGASRLSTRLSSALCLCLALLFGQSAASANAWQHELPRATVQGSGDFRFFGLRIYTARLWSEALPFDARARFALELTYHRSIARDRFVSTSLDEIRRLFGEKVPEATLLRWRGHMQQAFTDVKSGDQLIGVNLPGQGCRFYNRERLLAEIADPEFAQAFFAIWFDERSRDESLRRALTGNARAQLAEPASSSTIGPIGSIGPIYIASAARP